MIKIKILKILKFEKISWKIVERKSKKAIRVELNLEIL